jgi:hypothetical protein
MNNDTLFVPDAAISDHGCSSTIVSALTASYIELFRNGNMQQSTSIAMRNPGYTLPLYLQLLAKELVHPRHLLSYAQVDGPVANLDDETASNIRVDLWHDLQLLSLTDIL